MADVQTGESALCIAIDFGTAYSGYCFQFKDSKQIRQVKWGSEYGHDTPKTPTCILFDEKGTFLKFGYDAIEIYNRQTPKEEAKKLYLFDNFKMELYGKELNRSLMITAKNGKQMSAMKVFSESLKFMKDHALEMIGKHTAGRKYSASDVTWVLTVPAIWSPAAKQFMREASEEAGLVTKHKPDRLIVALEPEAASVWCKQLSCEGFTEGDLNEADKIEDEARTQYMVVDCGGGTIDITVHEVMEGGLLKELHKVSGNDMGGQTVDKNFREFLRETLSEKVFEEFEKGYPADLYRLMCDFSTCKRSERNALVQCPLKLQKIAGEDKIEECFSGLRDAQWDEGSILLSKEKLRYFHEDSLGSIEDLISQILEKPDLKISCIFLVGGFALSPHVSRFVREKFGSRCMVLCPIDAQAAVMKGAVTFGSKPNIVQSRISLYSYGISICRRFDTIKHKGKGTKVSKDRIVYCNVCFKSFVKTDESVDFDEVREYTFSPVDRDQTTVDFTFYRTESTTAEFVDEEGVENIGNITVPLPDTKKGMDRSIRLQISFGFTELKATATDVDSGETRSANLDFMTK